MGNLKSAPLNLNGDLVAKLTGDRPAFGKGIVHLSIERPAKIDLGKVPSSMEELARSWSSK